MSIPKIVHHFWVTGGPSKIDNFPELWERKYKRFRESWMYHNPDWSFIFWNDTNWPEQMNQDWKDLLANPDVNFICKEPVRYEILRLFGGICPDCDVECLKSFDVFLKDGSFSGIECEDGNIGNAITGCEPNNPAWPELLRIDLKRIRNNHDLCVERTVRMLGPRSPQEQAALRTMNKIYPREYFYPFNCMEPNKRNMDFPGSYAKHHWTGKDPDGWMELNSDIINKVGK